MHNSFIRKYIDYMIIGIKEGFAYKSSMWASFLAKVVYLYMQFCLWNALFMSQAKTALSMTKDGTLRYVIVATVISSFMECNAIQWINSQIQSGNIALQIIRPINFSAMVFSKHAGESAVKFFTCCLPLGIVSVLFFRMPLVCFPQIGFGLASVLLAYAITFLYSLIIGLMAFWLIVTWPLNMLLGAIYKLLSGTWIPCAMFPDFLKKLNAFLPFRAMYEIPVTILTSPMDERLILSKLAVQFFWLLFLFCLMKITWKVGTKKLVVQGG
ncbi:MAG: ABC-2 family transporter protein [Treponema sp.]|nr:ABC-2 family transporter protein [Treponema sp.]